MNLCERHAHRSLERPALVVALDGWVDAGLGADGAISTLLSSGPTELVATFDGESLIDQRARRPVVHIVDGVNRGLTWPVIQVRAASDRNGADVCFLVGPEPDFRWNPFTDEVINLARDMHVRIAVGLGAFPAPAPH
ncbi:MAG TPA: PAC2 family protein, partial [Acidimicrobiales bacterium]|nr:PAC2 family protein [Acidimicrobiales bacterium]